MWHFKLLALLFAKHKSAGQDGDLSRVLHMEATSGEKQSRHMSKCALTYDADNVYALFLIRWLT